MKPFSFDHLARPASSNMVTPMRRMRVFWVVAIFVFWAGLICARLVWLQVVRHSDFVAQAARQQERTFAVAPRRGVLYDRNLHELAMTVSVDSIYAVPGEIESARRHQVASALAKILHTDPTDEFTSAAQIVSRLDSSRYFTWIARKQDPAAIAQVRALNLKGVYFQKEFKRFYPENDIAAQVLGYVGTDDGGLGGVEQKYDVDLHGVQGRMLTALDARRHVLGSEEREPSPGANLVLTLDANIQFMAEQALDHAMQRVKPLNGTVVVQDPHTGQILALAIRPTFNPNDFHHATTDLLRDHAVSDVYEPGSTFKLVTYSAALEEKVTTPEAKIDCQGGKIVVAGRTVHDDHYNGVLTTSQALWESSDVAAIKLALRMGPNTFYKYIHGYGFGVRSGLEVPGETRGLMKPPERWQPTTIGSVPMGQEVGVTPIQLVTMASTLANGGVYLPPHLILRSTDKMKGNPDLRPASFHPEDSLPDPLPAGAHRVVSTMTAAEMRKMMEGVVLYGTGTPAQLNGYSAGGKTGTAQKIDVRTHTYSKTKYVASFVGMAPVNNPAVTIAVVIDSPTVGGHFGRAVSAPVFHELAQEVLEYLGVPHDEPLKSAPELARAEANARPEPASEQVGDLNALFSEVNNLPADDPLRAIPAVPNLSEPKQLRPSEQTAAPAIQADPTQTAMVSGAGRAEVPSLLGASVRQVMERAATAGFGIQVIGTGLAREQAPAAGTLAPLGAEIIVRFAR